MSVIKLRKEISKPNYEKHFYTISVKASLSWLYIDTRWVLLTFFVFIISISEYHEAFSLFDRNGDGHISGKNLISLRNLIYF